MNAVELTMEDIVTLVNASMDEFIIHVMFGEDTDEEESV